MFGSGAMQNAQDQQRLMSEGMTAAESANALDAAGAEGRPVGSAVEERQRVFDQAAKERRAQALVGTGALAVEPGVKNVLVIDGTGTSSDFMSEALLLLAGDAQRPSQGKPTTDEQRRAVEASVRTWGGLRHERLGLEGGERPDRLELCRRAISSGRFHALILSDLSDDSRAIPAVERELGPTLQRFVQGGGAIAVTTSDAAMTLPMLQRLFGVPWTSGSYYRTTWGPSLENAAAVAVMFPGALATSSFSAKAHAVRNVPEQERLFGTTQASASQRHVPSMVQQRDAMAMAAEQREGGTRTDADSVLSAPEDHDVVVARHACGEGALVLFCDVSMEPATVQLCLSFCRTASPALPADGAARLDDDECARAAERKAKGNAAFGTRDYAAAVTAYGEALGVYGDRGGAAGVQREEKVKTSSNLAECFLKLERWEEAAVAASDALALAPTHTKSLVRRAKAAARLGEIEGAMRDLRCVEGGGDATQAAVAAALLRPLETQLREAKRDQKRKVAEKNNAFAAGFAGALGGGGGGGSGGGEPQGGGVVPPPAGKYFFEDRPLDGGQRVEPSKSPRDDEKLDDIYDEHGYVYCAHGQEQCELCGSDHRIANELERRGFTSASDALFTSASDAVYSEVHEGFEARNKAECDYVKQLHLAGGGGAFSFGTRYSYDLRNEMLTRFGDQLPPWPPALATTLPPRSPPRPSRRASTD